MILQKSCRCCVETEKTKCVARVAASMNGAGDAASAATDTDDNKNRALQFAERGFYKFAYRSSRKYGTPRDWGGWSSFFLRMETMSRTRIVTTYGSILNSSSVLRDRPGM